MRKPIRLTAGRVAALFIDLQEEHRRDSRYLVEGYDRVIANARRLQVAARANAITLHHFAYVVDVSAGIRPYHPVMPDGRSAFSDSGDPMTAICAEVAPEAGEALVAKSDATAFRSGLAETLRDGGVEWLVISGVWTEACVDATVKDAIGHGFRVLLVKDACGSGTDAMHRTGILNLANRLYGGALVDTAAACRLLAGSQEKAWVVEGAVPLRYSFATAAAIYDEL